MAVVPLAYHHLPQVADLLEKAFADIMDAEGERFLNHLRHIPVRFNPPWRPGWIPELGMQGWVWEEGGRVVGHAGVYPVRSPWPALVLVNVAVAPAYRRRGIAQELVEQAIAFARRRGLPLWLEMDRGNVAARALYEKLGFRPVTVRVRWTWTKGQLPQRVAVAQEMPPWNQVKVWLRRWYPRELDWRYPPGNLNLLAFTWFARLRRWWEGVRLVSYALRDTVLFRVERGAGVPQWLFLAAASEAAAIPALEPLMARVLRPWATFYLDLPAEVLSEPLEALGFCATRHLEVWRYEG